MFVIPLSSSLSHSRRTFSYYMYKNKHCKVKERNCVAVDPTSRTYTESSFYSSFHPDWPKFFSLSLFTDSFYRISDGKSLHGKRTAMQLLNLTDHDYHKFEKEGSSLFFPSYDKDDKKKIVCVSRCFVICFRETDPECKKPCTVARRRKEGGLLSELDTKQLFWNGSCWQDLVWSFLFLLFKP